MLLNRSMVSEGPRATSVEFETATVAGHAGVGKETSHVTVHFSGGTSPFFWKPTQNCAACCGSAQTPTSNDFDASADGGASWVNGTHATVVGGTDVVFDVALPTVTHVRYTANQPFPQCAIYNQQQLPGAPFILAARSRSEPAAATEDDDGSRV
jgi:hypothetical protein